MMITLFINNANIQYTHIYIEVNNAVVHKLETSRLNKIKSIRIIVCE